MAGTGTSLLASSVNNCSHNLLRKRQAADSTAECAGLFLQL